MRRIRKFQGLIVPLGRIIFQARTFPITPFSTVDLAYILNKNKWQKVHEFLFNLENLTRVNEKKIENE